MEGRHVDFKSVEMVTSAAGIDEGIIMFGEINYKINKHGDLLWQKAYVKSTSEGIQVFPTMYGFGFATTLSTLDPHYDGNTGALLSHFDQSGNSGYGSESSTKLVAKAVSFQTGSVAGVMEQGLSFSGRRPS
jgi:hypothetical protein